MEYHKIVAVTGLPGLYELLSSKTDGAIVRSLEDKIAKFVSSRVHNFSHLESIEVFTKRENVNLVDVLKAMETSQEKLPDDKDANALKSYFAKVYPEMDFDRVYSSDLKKMVKWFSVLKSNGVELKLSEVTEEEIPVEEVTAPVAEEVKPKEKKKAKEEPKKEQAEEKPVKASTKKPKEEKKEEETPAAKPKKAPAKKKSDK